MLSDADLHRQIVRVHCYYCRITHRYFPADLITLIGNVPAYDLARRFRCETCHKKDYLQARCESIYGNELGKMQVRRLVKIVTLQRPIWRDGVL